MKGKYIFDSSYKKIRNIFFDLRHPPPFTFFLPVSQREKMAEHAHEFMNSREPEIGFYYLSMVVCGGKFRGIRGATYKLAFDLGACRRHDADVVRYGNTAETSSNVYLEMFFETRKQRRDFIHGVKKIHKIPEVLEKCSPQYKPEVKVLIERSFTLRDSEVASVTEEELELMVEKSPAGSIDYDYDTSTQDLGSYTSSTPRRKKPRSSGESSRSSGQLDGRSSSRLSSTSARSRAKSLVFKWQSFENPIHENYMYSCHLLDRRYTDNTPLSHPDNFVGGYGDFHNGLDGLQSPGTVPRFVLEWLRDESTFEDAEDGRRQKVWVRLRFRDVEMANIWYPVFRQSFKDGSIFVDDNRTIESFVHVRDAVEFKRMLEVKKALTEVDWREHGFM